jgi:hypothetical protein
MFLAVLAFRGYSQTSYLQLSLFDDMDFSVVLDNNALTTGNFAEFDNISAGEHYLKVTKEGPNVPAQANIVFDGKIKIPSGYDIYAVIDEYDAFMIYKKKAYGFNRLIPLGEFSRRCGGTEGVNSNKDKDNKDKYNANDECKYKAIDKEKFGDLKSSINNMSFENANVSAVRKSIDENYFSSVQLREILKYFSSESNKLEIAKYSYTKICDRNNFSKVYDAFDFDSSVQELKNYISGK